MKIICFGDSNTWGYDPRGYFGGQYDHPWPEILQVLEECHFHHYSISIKGNELFTYYEYTGDDLEADERRMGESPDMQRWWTHTKPCFLYHDEGHYYDDLTEIFYKN